MQRNESVQVMHIFWTEQRQKLVTCFSCAAKSKLKHSAGFLLQGRYFVGSATLTIGKFADLLWGSWPVFCTWETTRKEEEPIRTLHLPPVDVQGKCPIDSYGSGSSCHVLWWLAVAFCFVSTKWKLFQWCPWPCAQDINFWNTNEYALSRDWVTIDGVSFCNRIYWTP